MPRLRRVACSRPGIRRRRQGKGFSYIDPGGLAIKDPEVLDRVRALAIPPAWRDVWICPDPWGHLQAVGTDAAGRRQYLYHPKWRQRRDQQKFDEMLAFARALPRVRQTTAEHLALEGMPPERALACAVRLLDRGFFRIGGETYAAENGSVGLATMRREHVSIHGQEVVFEYRAKGGKERLQSVVDPEVAEVVRTLKRRRGGGVELLAYRAGRAWRDVKSGDINTYLKAAAGGDFSAKDFRTWHATVLAAVALAVSTEAAASPTARKRAVTRAVKEVSQYLGNTPTVCRNSYIDPRVVDRYEAGVTIAGVLGGLGADPAPQPSITEAVEAAVIDLLEDNSSPAVEKAA